MGISQWRWYGNHSVEVVWESFSGGGMGIIQWRWYGNKSVEVVWESVSGGDVRMGVWEWDQWVVVEKDK